MFFLLSLFCFIRFSVIFEAILEELKTALVEEPFKTLNEKSLKGKESLFGPFSAFLYIFWVWCYHRSSHWRFSVKKGVLRNFAKFTGKQLCQSLFFNKVAGIRPVTLFKKRLWDKCFSVNFAKFLRKPFWHNTSEWPLLFFCKTIEVMMPMRL